MADTIKISELTELNSGSASSTDVLPLTNDGDNTTYKISLDSIDYYIKTFTGSRKFISGSIERSTFATSSLTSSYLNYTGGNTGTASYALNGLSSSFALNCESTISSSFALTASYVKNVNYAEIETASFAKSASFLIYNPVRSNGTASFAISSSNARSASYVSGSNVYALSSSYTLSSSYGLTSSYSLSSSNSLSASYAFSSSTSLTSISTSYISDDLLYNRLSRKYTVANPMATISSGSYQYVFGWNRHPENTETGIQIYKINNNNRNVEHVCDLNSLQLYRFTNLSLVSSSYSGRIYYAWNLGYNSNVANGRTYSVPSNNFVSSSINEYRTTTSQGNALFWTQVVVDIDDTDVNFPIFYGVDSDSNTGITTNDIELYRFKPANPGSPSKTNYTREIVGGNGQELNLIDNAFNGSTEFKKFEPVNAYVLFFFFNPVSKRIYLITSATGLLHIFNIQNYFSSNPTGHFADWWDVKGATRYSHLTYEKTISIGDNEGPYSNDNSDHYSLEYDLNTGKELYINFSRRGNSIYTGTVYKVPWME